METRTKIVDLDQETEVVLMVTANGFRRVLGKTELVALLENDNVNQIVGPSVETDSLKSLSKWLQSNRFVGKKRKKRLSVQDCQQILARLKSFKGPLSARSKLTQPSYLPALKATPGASNDLKQAIDELLGRV